jgi:FAD-dependent fumarate reductase
MFLAINILGADFYLAPEALRAHGGILLNKLTGKRFVNELATRAALSDAIFAHCRSEPDEVASCYMVFNEKGAKDFGMPNLGFYLFKGLVQVVENGVEGLSTITSIPKETLIQTFVDYNEVAKIGKDEFGKVVFPITFDTTEKLCECV